MFLNILKYLQEFVNFYDVSVKAEEQHETQI